MIATARPHTRMLYIAFNKAVQLEADASFPSNVTCRTAHALAYREFGAPMRTRLNGPRMTGAQNARALGIRSRVVTGPEQSFSETAQAAMAMGMVWRYCRSADTTIGSQHFIPPEGLSRDETAQLANHLLPFAQKAWADLTAGRNGRLKPTHDIYLKQWQLFRPQLSCWDVVLYDEAQDADPCTADVVEHQDHAQLIAVGDSAQAIFAWRGAGDFLSRVNAKHRLQLTRSWRFGAAVADEANVWLGVVGTDLRVVGNPRSHSVLAPLAQPDAVLCRSNAGTIEELSRAHDASTKVHLVGGGRAMLALAQAADRLQHGQRCRSPRAGRLLHLGPAGGVRGERPDRVGPGHRCEDDRAIWGAGSPADNRRYAARSSGRRGGFHRAQEQRSRMGQGQDRQRLPGASRQADRASHFPSRARTRCWPTCPSPGRWARSILAVWRGSTITSPPSPIRRARPSTAKRNPPTKAGTLIRLPWEPTSPRGPPNSRRRLRQQAPLCTPGSLPPPAVDSRLKNPLPTEAFRTGPRQNRRPDYLPG